MAVKAQEKKTSQREILLERKVKSLEEELEKARVQLDREYLAQEAKKAKVHFNNFASNRYKCTTLVICTKISKYIA